MLFPVEQYQPVRIDVVIKIISDFLRCDRAENAVVLVIVAKLFATFDEFFHHTSPFGRGYIVEVLPLVDQERELQAPQLCIADWDCPEVCDDTIERLAQVLVVLVLHIRG